MVEKRAEVELDSLVDKLDDHGRYLESGEMFVDVVEGAENKSQYLTKKMLDDGGVMRGDQGRLWYGSGGTWYGSGETYIYFDRYVLYLQLIQASLQTMKIL